MGGKVLVIDDERRVLEAIQIILSDLGHVVECADDPVDGTAEALRGDYDLVLVDIHMPGRNGAQVIEDILQAKPGSRVLILTADPTHPLAKRALDAGAKALLKKPFEIAKVLEYLQG